MVGLRYLGLVLALGFITGSWGMTQEAANVPEALGSIAIRSQPSPALVYIDGHFVGQTSELGPLTVTRQPGRVQIRLTQTGYPDTVFRWKVEPKRCHRLEVSLGQTLIPSGPVQIGVGQACRGVFPGKEAQSITYVSDEARPHRRTLITLHGGLEFEVTDPEGRVIPLMPGPVHVGTPGRRAYSYSGTIPGRYSIRVTGEPGGRFAFRLSQALPPPADTENPRYKGRLAAPR